jgi:uncharacterized damage-inducible protein DinB
MFPGSVHQPPGWCVDWAEADFYRFFFAFTRVSRLCFLAQREVARMDFQKELIAEYDRETATTRKILEAIREGADFGWKPHEKSMTLGKLAGHVSDSHGDWALHSLTMDRLDWTADMNPVDPTNRKDLLERFEKQVAQVKPALEGITPEKWDIHWKLVAGDQTWIDDTRYNVWRTWVMNHLIHHRAQLGVYLRLLGQKLPGTYGPSADEM